MSRVTFPVAKGRIARATVLDSCGIPAWGNKAMLTSKGFVSVAITANYDDGTELTQTNADGDDCFTLPAKAKLKNLSLAVVFCGVDPEFYTVASGMPKITDPLTGDVIGFRINRGITPLDVNWALELWSYAQGEAGCDQETGEVPWAYTIWPFLAGGRVSDYTIANDTVTFGIEQAFTRDGSGWGLGPYEVVGDDTGAADLLQEAIDSLDHQYGPLRTYVQPPEETDGLIPLDDPDGDPATTATAGIPGSFNGTRPEDIAAIRASAITGSGGVTAWTTGQYVFLGDGSKTHWAGSGASPKWVVGPKP